MLCYIACLIFKFPSALLVSVIIGVTNIIPFFGFKYPSSLPGYFITSALAVAVTVIVSLIPE